MCDARTDSAALATAEQELDERERDAVRSAVLKRRREFAGGRWCAKRALERLGRPPVPIGVGARREPLWPPDVVGSISHAAGYCVAAVAAREACAALGLDVEPAEDLPRDLWGKILRPTEVAWLERAADRAGLYAKLIFSAKEAVYKCQYPLTQAWLDFLDIEIVPDLASRSFDVCWHKCVEVPRADAWTGRFALDAELIRTAIEIEAS
ncbi:MAG: 4'-phosphopantetheinyl transferase superfamily protein [bacterium]|nr:4'-phosphopantetheinyl transferase superfamily protein [bacterium]